MSKGAVNSIGNLVYVLDRLDKDPKLASMKSELRSQAMAILNHPMTVEYFASTLSHGLLDGYSERGIHLRRYFELVAVAQPGIWKSIVAKKNRGEPGHVANQHVGFEILDDARPEILPPTLD